MLQFSQGQVIMLLIVFAVGFVIGAAIAWLLAGREKDKETSPEQSAWLKLREQFIERTSLWQNRATGKLVVRIDEQMIDRPDQLGDLQRTNLNATMKEWLVWMGFPGSPPSTPSPVEPGLAKTPASQPPAVSAVRSETSSPQPPSGMKAAEAAVASLMGQSPTKPAVEKPKSIVEQIDEILQDKIKNTPGLQKGVKLVEDPKEGVVVWVGLDHYAGVDAVTDPEVKALLRAAAAEWEQQHTVGKR